jgi:hypothetical protein
LTGTLVALVGAEALSGMLFGVSPADPAALAAATATLAIAAVLANLIPSVRAVRVDPIAALRVE